METATKVACGKERFITTTEAARRLGYASTKGISQRIQRGKIPGAEKQGGVWCVPEEWVKNQKPLKEDSSPNIQISHPEESLRNEERSSRIPQIPHPEESSTFLTPLQQHYQSLTFLAGKLAQLEAERQRITISAASRQKGNGGFYIHEYDKKCSSYKCRWRANCIFYRTKGCPSYEESIRQNMKYAVGEKFYSECKRLLPLLPCPPCLLEPA